MIPTLSSIPSPSTNVIVIGPLHLRFYGLGIALGVLAAVAIAGRRWERRGGDRGDIAMLATWAVPAGVIGARLYHVATDWKTYFGPGGHPIDSVKIWQGGLGIPGGILFGVIVGLIVARRKGLDGVGLLDSVAPAIPVAQAIGRLGNWFNQELFGRPTTLPWGLRIDAAHMPAGYPPGTLFHPTFLYESLWNLALAALLIFIDNHKRLRRGELFTLYVLGYALGRLWVEDLRIDKASLIFGVRVNLWMSGIVLVVTLIVFVRNRLRGPAEPAPGGPVSTTPEGDQSDTLTLGAAPTPRQPRGEAEGDGGPDSEPIG